MMYVEVWLPLPHGFVQLVQVVQLPTQSTGHGCVLHDVELTKPLAKLQFVPPYAAGVVTTKVDVCVPLPQSLVQLVQAVQVPTQSTGHCCVLQDVVLTVLLANVQGVPPPEAFLFMMYVWLVVPPPHAALQVVALVQPAEQGIMTGPLNCRDPAFTHTTESYDASYTASKVNQDHNGGRRYLAILAAKFSAGQVSQNLCMSSLVICRHNTKNMYVSALQSWCDCMICGMLC